MTLPSALNQELLGLACKQEKEPYCLLAQPLARPQSAQLQYINKAVEREKGRQRETERNKTEEKKEKEVNPTRNRSPDKS